MAQYTTTQTVLFQDLGDRAVSVAFDEPHSSSDGGAILLKAADRKLGLLEKLSGVLVDQRESWKVRHQIQELLSQRIFGLACGYHDGNDASRLAEDPIFKLLVGRDPIAGASLASQPTLSRFENSVRRADLYRMGEAILDVVLDQHRERLSGRAKRVTIDLDSTDLETHGAQQLALFNGFYGEWCYLPHVAFLTFDDEPEQYSCVALLRSGRAPAALGLIGLLRRMIRKVRASFPGVIVRVRLDGGFAGPILLDYLEAERVEYVVGVAENKVLARLAEPLMKVVRRATKRSGVSESRFKSTWYRAKKWSHRRRVVIKAEVTRHENRSPRDNARYVITNLRDSAEEIYRVDYCGRGESENRIKEMKQLGIDRVSCSDFLANHLRVLMALAAHVLVQEVRGHATRRVAGRLQAATIRERLFKLSARVFTSVRRVVLHLPLHCPFRETWCLAARALGASVG